MSFTSLGAEVLIDDMIEESRKELIEEKIPRGLRKIYLAETRRFVKLLTTQLQWYGVPYRLKRLPSTVCPICEHELIQEEGRIMVCTNCGFKAPRDMVPMYWAIKINTRNQTYQLNGMIFTVDELAIEGEATQIDEVYKAAEKAINEWRNKLPKI